MYFLLQKLRSQHTQFPAELQLYTSPLKERLPEACKQFFFSSL